MKEKHYKIPMIFDYILTAILFAMFFAVFLGIEFFAIVQFLSVLIMFVFFMLDKKYGEELCDHKITYFLFDIVILISLISLLGFEIEYLPTTLCFLIIATIVVVSILIIFDVFYIDDGFFEKFWCNIINTIKLCAMICVMTYYNGVTSNVFAVLIIVLIAINIFASIYATCSAEKKKKVQAEAVAESVADVSILTDSTEADDETDEDINEEINEETVEVLTTNQIEDIIYRQGE